MTDVHEGSAVELDEAQSNGQGQEIVPRAPGPIPSLAITPQATAEDLVVRLGAIRDAQQKAMTRDVDYGVIPGTDKPTLYKPGAEKLSVLFQLDVQLTNEKTWGPGDHLTVVSHATVFHAPTGSRLGYGEGVCSTRERKYAYRKQERTCPMCGAAAVIKGKAEFGGGWLCWRKRDGCGAKFSDGAAEIEQQEVGEIDNPDLPDLWNTVVKMAEKRARVDAVLAVTGASALFTQDLEDQAQPADEVAEQEVAAPSPRREPLPEKTVEELALMASQLIKRKVWDGHKLHMHLTAAGATHFPGRWTPKTVAESVATVTPEGAEELREKMIGLLAVPEASA